jgi:hypothetical protein
MHGEFATIKGTTSRTILIYLFNAFAAKYMAARKENFNIIAILSATSACHFGFPQLILHLCYVHVECRDLSCSCITGLLA